MTLPKKLPPWKMSTNFEPKKSWRFVESMIFNDFQLGDFLGEKKTVHFLPGVPSLKLTYPLKIGLPNRKVVFQPSIFRGYVSCREGSR